MGDRSGSESPPRGGADHEADDVVLARRVRTGDHAAFEHLYRRHVGRIYGLCLRLVADPVQAEILTQDVFVRAWRKIGTFAERGPFGGWLRRLAVNVVVEDRRSAARHNQRTESLEARTAGPQSSLSAEELGIGLQPGPGEQEAVDVAMDLDRALLRLPPGARLAFVLHDVMGYPQAEVAEMTGVAVGTIKAQLHRARRLLRAELDPDV